MDPDQEHLEGVDLAQPDRWSVRTTITKAQEPVDPDQQLLDLATPTHAGTPPSGREGDGRTRITRAKEEVDPDRSLVQLTHL